MESGQKKLINLIAATAFVFVAVWLVTGCETLDNPVSGSSNGQELLSPAPKDERGRDASLDDHEGDCVTRTIGRSGGQIMLGHHKLHIPNGALDSLTSITMCYDTESEVGVTFEPEGLVFGQSASLTLSFRGTSYEGNHEGLLAIFYVPDDDPGHPDQLPSNVDVRNKKVIAPLNHFSRYVVAQRSGG